MQFGIDRKPERRASPLERQRFDAKAAVCLVLAFAALAGWPAFSIAHEFSAKECAEGSDFIKNAALARDGGISETAFINKIRDDIESIQAYPPALRWFVQDEDDAAFLIDAAVAVFRQPKPAGIHQEDFLHACLARSQGRQGRESSSVTLPLSAPHISD